MSAGLWLPDGKFRAFSEPSQLPATGEIITSAAHGGDLGWFWGLLPDPDEVLKKLGVESSKVLASLLADARVGACVSGRKSGTKSKALEIRPGGESAADKKAAEEAEAMVKGWDLGRIVSEILDAPLWGMAPLEVIWDTDNQRWTILDLVGKPSWWFAFDDQRRLRFVTQGKAGGEEIPPYKVLLPRHEPSYHNPYGVRLLSRIYWPVVFKRAGWRLWPAFVEKFGADFILTKAPPNSSVEERKALAAEMAAMMSRSSLVYPDGGEVTVAGSASKGASSLVHEKFVAACDAEIAVAILGGTLTQEVKGQGSRAAAETHYKVRQDLAEEDQRLVLATLNRALKWWTNFNHPGAAPPVFGFVQEEDLARKKSQADLDEVLARQGVRFTTAYYSRVYGLPEDEFEIVERLPAPVGLGSPAQPGEVAYLVQSDDPDDDAPTVPADIKAWLVARDKDLERLVSQAVALGGVPALADDVLTVVDRAVDQAEDLDEVTAKILAAVPDIKIDRLAGEVERAHFAANMYGRWAVIQELGDKTGPKLSAAEIELEPLPMDEAIKFWRRKKLVSPRTFKRLPEEARLHAFAVAGIAKGQALELVFGELARALEDGISLHEFRRACREEFEKRGWTGKAARRADLIFKNNIGTAYEVGRYAQLTDKDVLASHPYWMYVAVEDSRTRPAHRAMSGRVFRADDPIWDQWYPLNGHGCRCTVIAISERQLKKRGLKVESGQDILDGVPQNLPGPDGRPSGIVQSIRPDTGWDYNPGKAAWGGIVDQALSKKGGYDHWPRPLPGHDSYRLPAFRNLKKLDTQPAAIADIPDLKKRGLSRTEIGRWYHDQAVKSLGIEAGERIAVAPDGETLIISSRFWGGESGAKLLKGRRGQYIPLFRPTLESPDEIWLTPMINEATGKVILRRKHLKFWRGKGENVGAYAVMDFDGQVCTGVTIYDIQDKQEAVDRNYRRGALLWARWKRK